jgi:hypothetical protein
VDEGQFQVGLDNLGLVPNSAARESPVIDGECIAALGRPKTKILREPGRCAVARPRQVNQAKGSRQSKYYKLSKRKCRAEGHRDDIAGNRSGCGPCKMILSSLPQAEGLFMHAQTGVKGTKVATKMRRNVPDWASRMESKSGQGRSYIIAQGSLLHSFRTQSVLRL